jgi:hypothetical protein
VAMTTATFDDDVYEIPASLVAEMPAVWRAPVGVTPATCTLKAAVLCPHCGESIRSVHVVGLERSQAVRGAASPVRSLVVVCPECEDVVPAELAGL